MIGYPFYNESDDLEKDDKFMIFSLDPIKEDSELNLIQVSSLPIVVESTTLVLGDEFTYQFCNQISQLCLTLKL